MTEFIISGMVVLLAIVALGFTIRQRKKLKLSAFLYLAAFEVVVILAAAWVLVIYGAIMEMGNL